MGKSPAVTNETTIYFTKKGKDLYVLCTKFPTQDITVEGITKPAKATMLGLNAAVKTVFKAGKLSISPPAVTPANNPCHYAWVFKLENVL